MIPDRGCRLSKEKKNQTATVNGKALSRRQFLRLAGTSAVAFGSVSRPQSFLIAAQPARKRIVVHTERQMHAIDREAMVQSIFKGEKLVSHFSLSRIRKSYKQAMATATIYKYDPERAKKLLAGAGWKPGAEGVLVNDKGERMEFDFRVQAGRREHEQAQAVIADFWKKIGVRTNIKNLPNRLLNAAENRNRWPGAYIGTHNVTVEEWAERFHTKNIPTAENKYATENVSGWNDPRKDAILDELNSIITPERSEKLQLEFVKLFSE